MPCNRKEKNVSKVLISRAPWHSLCVCVSVCLSRHSFCRSNQALTRLSWLSPFPPGTSEEDDFSLECCGLGGFLESRSDHIGAEVGILQVAHASYTPVSTCCTCAHLSILFDSTRSVSCLWRPRNEPKKRKSKNKQKFVRIKHGKERRQKVWRKQRDRDRDRDRGLVCSWQRFSSALFLFLFTPLRKRKKRKEKKRKKEKEHHTTTKTHAQERKSFHTSAFEHA